MAFSLYCYLKALLVFASLFPLGSCDKNEPGPYPGASVIIISVDTLRSDRLPVYGYQGIETPQISEFAEQAVLFERAYSPYPLTLPSHSTLFTGLLPPEHGVRDNSFYELQAGQKTLAEVLKAEGYQTAGVVSSVILGPRTGINQGFDYYESDFRDEYGRTYASRDGESSIKLALNWIKSQPKSKPKFLFLHLFEPHSPYQAPEPFSAMGKHPYDGEVAYTDHLLGQFFDDLKQAGEFDPSLILLVSDHGEGLGDHGEAEHGILLYREALQVPFILKLPKSERAGKRYSHPVMLADIKPTLETLLGVEVTPVSGRCVFDSDTDWQNRPIFSETRYPANNYGYAPGRSVIRGDDHFIQFQASELYNLQRDPRETQNLLPGQPVAEAITGYLEALGQGVDAKSGESDGDLELLASLGYSAVQVATSQNQTRPIAELVAAIHVLDEAADHVKNGNVVSAEKLLEQLLEEQPCLHQARLDLAKIWERKGEVAALERLYEEALLCDAKNLRFLMLTGILKIRRGDLDQALQLAEQVWNYGTEEAKGEFAYAFFQNGYKEEADHFAGLLLEKNSKNAYGNLILGEQLLKSGAWEEAIPFLKVAAESFSYVQEPRLEALAFQGLGESYRQTDALDAALQAYEQALELEPNHAASRVATCLIWAGKGAFQRAIAIMDAWVRDFPSKLSYETAANTMMAIGQQDAAAFFREQARKYPR